MEELDDGDGEHELGQPVRPQHDRAHQEPCHRAGDRADDDQGQGSVTPFTQAMPAA